MKSKDTDSRAEQAQRDQEFTEAVRALVALRNPDGSDVIDEAVINARGLVLDVCLTCGTTTLHKDGICIECRLATRRGYRSTGRSTEI